MEPVKLKPLVFTNHPSPRFRQNTTQQILLLKAMQVTQDPNKLRQMIGVKTVADVWRTLDKMSMRKEYHKALGKHGISFDYIVAKMKGLVEVGSDKVSLAALQTLLKSVGMEKYEGEAGVGTGSWEEALLAKLEKEKEQKQLAPGTMVEGEVVEEAAVPEYEVEIPEVPDSIKAQRVEEDETTRSIYDPK